MEQLLAAFEHERGVLEAGGTPAASPYGNPASVVHDAGFTGLPVWRAEGGAASQAPSPVPLSLHRVGVSATLPVPDNCLPFAEVEVDGWVDDLLPFADVVTGGLRAPKVQFGSPVVSDTIRFLSPSSFAIPRSHPHFRLLSILLWCIEEEQVFPEGSPLLSSAQHLFFVILHEGGGLLRGTGWESFFGTLTEAVMLCERAKSAEGGEPERGEEEEEGNVEEETSILSDAGSFTYRDTVMDVRHAPCRGGIRSAIVLAVLVGARLLVERLASEPEETRSLAHGKLFASGLIDVLCDSVGTRCLWVARSSSSPSSADSPSSPSSTSTASASTARAPTVGRRQLLQATHLAHFLTVLRDEFFLPKKLLAAVSLLEGTVVRLKTLKDQQRDTAQARRHAAAAASAAAPAPPPPPPPPPAFSDRATLAEAAAAESARRRREFICDIVDGRASAADDDGDGDGGKGEEYDCPEDVLEERCPFVSHLYDSVEGFLMGSSVTESGCLLMTAAFSLTVLSEASTAQAGYHGKALRRPLHTVLRELHASGHRPTLHLVDHLLCALSLFAPYTAPKFLFRRSLQSLMDEAAALEDGQVRAHRGILVRRRGEESGAAEEGEEAAAKAAAAAVEAGAGIPCLAGRLRRAGFESEELTVRMKSSVDLGDPAFAEALWRAGEALFGWPEEQLRAHVAWTAAAGDEIRTHAAVVVGSVAAHARFLFAPPAGRTHVSLVPAAEPHLAITPLASGFLHAMVSAEEGGGVAAAVAAAATTRQQAASVPGLSESDDGSVSSGVSSRGGCAGGPEVNPVVLIGCLAGWVEVVTGENHIPLQQHSQLIPDTALALSVYGLLKRLSDKRRGEGGYAAFSCLAAAVAYAQDSALIELAPPAAQRLMMALGDVLRVASKTTSGRVLFESALEPSPLLFASPASELLQQIRQELCT